MVKPADGARLARLLARLPAPAGLCADCRHLKLVESLRSVFVRCRLAEEDPRLRRYPPLPVVRCPGHRRR